MNVSEHSWAKSCVRITTRHYALPLINPTSQGFANHFPQLLISHFSPSIAKNRKILHLYILQETKDKKPSVIPDTMMTHLATAFY